MCHTGERGVVNNHIAKYGGIVFTYICITSAYIKSSGVHLTKKVS